MNRLVECAIFELSEDKIYKEIFKERELQETIEWKKRA
jgi:hypothetical protein